MFLVAGRMGTVRVGLEPDSNVAFWGAGSAECTFDLLDHANDGIRTLKSLLHGVRGRYQDDPVIQFSRLPTNWHVWPTTHARPTGCTARFHSLSRSAPSNAHAQLRLFTDSPDERGFLGVNVALPGPYFDTVLKFLHPLLSSPHVQFLMSLGHVMSFGEGFSDPELATTAGAFLTGLPLVISPVEFSLTFGPSRAAKRSPRGPAA